MTPENREPRIWLIPWVGGLILIIGFVALVVMKIDQRNKAGGESWQIGALRTIATAQTVYYQDHFDAQGEHEFARSVDELSSGKLIAPEFAGGVVNRWIIHLERPTRTAWWATATPLPGEPPATSVYYVDDTGVIRFSMSGPATATSTAIGG